MYVCMYVYVCMYIWKYIYIYLYIYLYIYMCMYVCIYVYVCVYVCMWMCIYVRMCICIYICINSLSSLFCATDRLLCWVRGQRTLQLSRAFKGCSRPIYIFFRQVGGIEMILPFFFFFFFFFRKCFVAWEFWSGLPFFNVGTFVSHGNGDESAF